MVKRIGAILVGVAMLLATTPAAASANPGDIRLASTGSGLSQCMDLSSYASYTPVTLYPCYGAVSQLWGNFGAQDGIISSSGSGYAQCMDVISYATSTPVSLYPCSGVPSQLWQFNANNTISNIGSGNTKCMDLTSYATYTQVIIYPCGNQASQKWNFV